MCSGAGEANTANRCLTVTLSFWIKIYVIRFIIVIKITITFLSRLKHLVYLLTVKERFYCALGPAYCEFSYNEQPDIMSKFLGNKIIDSNINKVQLQRAVSFASFYSL